MTAQTSPRPAVPACWPGLTQSAIRIAFDLPTGLSVDWPAIDPVLLPRIRAAAIVEPTLPPGVAADAPAIALARRILTAAGVLLRSARYPSFAAGQVVSVSEAASGKSRTSVLPAMARVWLRVPCFEGLSTEVFRQGYRHAREVALTAARDGPDAAGAVFERAHTALGELAAAAMPGGLSTVPLLKAAWTLGMPHRHLGGGIFLIGHGSAGRKFDRSSIEGDSALGARISGDKSISGELLRLAGLPVPRSVRVNSAAQAGEAASLLGFPVVLKPADRDRGEGVEVDLFDARQAAQAFERARALSANLLVEEQVAGTCHRILVADRTVAAVIRRDPKSVRGDGKRTVRALIDEANRNNEALPPSARATPFPCDALAIECLARVGLTLEAVPASNQAAPLRPIETGTWGGSPAFVTGEIHPDNAALAVRVARLLGLRVLGLDLVSRDIAVPWHENGARILEANYAPQVTGLSSAPQATIQALLSALVPDGGRIPVRAWVGNRGGALEAALSWQRALTAAGRRVHLTSHRETRAPEGPWPMALPGDGLFERTRALLLDPDVDGVGLVIETDELLETGLPVDRIDAVEVIDREVTDWREPSAPASPARVNALIGLLADATIRR